MNFKAGRPSNVSLRGSNRDIRLPYLVGLLALLLFCGQAHAVDLSPPGAIPRSLSPKATELKASLGAPMVRVKAAIAPAPIPPGSLYITNTVCAAGQMTLQWQGGSNVQMQCSSDGVHWFGTGEPTTAKTATFPAVKAREFFRLKEITAVNPGEAQLQRMFGGKAGVSSAGIVPNKIAVDSAGNVIIVGLMYYTVNAGAGEMASYGGQDAVIAKYTPSGACLWSKHYGVVSDDSFSGVCVDSQDNIYAIGSVSGGIWPGTYDFGFGPDATFGGADVLLVKLAPSGAILWHKLYGGTGGDQGRAIARDSNDDLYITGTHGFFGTGADFGGGALTSTGRPSAFLAKLHSDGSHVWSKSFGDAGNPSYGISIAVASDGNPVLGSEFTGSANWGQGPLASAGGYDAAIVKLDGSNGSTLWATPIAGTRDNRISSIATSTGNIYAVGDSAEAGGFYISQLDNSGAQVQSRTIGVTDGTAPHVSSVAASSLGVFVTGEMVTGIDFGQGYLMGQGGNDVMLLRFNPDFTVQWSRRGAPQGDSGMSLAIAGGSICLAGGCSSQFGLTGFERNTGFGATQIDPAKTVVTDSGVASTGFWVRFSL